MVLALDTSALEKVSITGNKLFSRNFDHGYQIQCNSNIRSNKRFWGSNLLQPRAKFFLETTDHNAPRVQLSNLTIWSHLKLSVSAQICATCLFMCWNCSYYEICCSW